MASTTRPVPRLILPILAILLFSSCSSRPADSVVLVIMDTVRADRVGARRDGRALTPHLDAFAADAATFSRAYAHAPWTLPSVASLFTSRIPARHGAGGRLGDFRELPGDAVTLAEACRDEGLRTAAVTNVQFVSERFGMLQGFEHVDVDVPESNLDARRAAPTTDAALAWLAAHADAPFLLVVHYFDPHLAYDPPQPYRRWFAAPEDREAARPAFGTFNQLMALRQGSADLSPDALRRLEALYDGEVAYVDAEVGRLLAGISEFGLDGRTVVAVVADHGEEFGEHGGFEHGHTLYDELLHVPLMVRAPGVTSGGIRATGAVALQDVAPTLCDLVGVPAPTTFDGRSLVPALRGERMPARAAVSQGNMWGGRQSSLRLRNWKLIVEAVEARDGGATRSRVGLFDLVADPAELENLAAERPDRLGRMLPMLQDALAGETVTGDEPELDDEELQRLRSLGYVQ